MVRQDPRYRGPAKCEDAKRTYAIKTCTAKIDWPCYKNALRKFSIENFRNENSRGVQQNRYKDTLKALLKDFNIPTNFSEQAVQDRTKWRCLTKKGAAKYEAKRICEAKRKRKKTKKEPRDQHQSRHSTRLLALFGIDSLEQTLA